ncbi:MAG TPA: 6-bladed beta-propeller [Gemmatimonadales bacterium]|jgi:sugar lactone lactonase YvrE
MHPNRFVSALAAAALVAAPLSAQGVARWRLIPEATFGSSTDPNPAAELADIRGFEVSKNGNVLVLDFKAQNIKVFSPSGAFLKTIGRNGGGPGEFEQPNGFLRAPDGTIWVNDPANHRYSVRRDDGEYIRDVPSAMTSFGYIWDATFDATGRLLSPVYVPARPGVSAQSRLERRNMKTQHADTLPTPNCAPANTRYPQWSGRSSHGGMMMPVPFIPSMPALYDPMGFVWCAWGATYAIYRIGLEHGDTQQVIRGSSAPVAVSAAERDSAVTNARKAFTQAQLDASIISAGDVPRTKPVIIGLASDDDHNLWVRLTPAVSGHTRYDVFNQKGKEIATIDAPVAIASGPNILVRGEYLWAVVRDADDIPAVVRFRVERRSTDQ